MKLPLSTRQSAGLDLHTIIKLMALAAFSVRLTLSAAEPVVQWAKVVGGPGSDWPEALALAPNGQVYLAGDINQKVLYRFDQNGTVLGTQASRGEYIRGVAVDSAGNYFLTGQIRDSKRLGVGLTNDFYLAKYSAAGTLIWERTGGVPTYSTVYTQQGNSLALDKSGNILVCGASSGPAVFGAVTLPDSPGGPLLCKYSPDGTLLWLKRVEGQGGGAATIALDADGSIAIAGGLANENTDFAGIAVSVAGPYGADWFVARLTSAGDVQWVRVGYGNTGLVVDPQGNIYFNGNTAGVTDMHFGKFKPTGELVWERSIPDAYGSYVVMDGKDEPLFSAGLTATVQLDDFVIPYNGLFGYLSDVLICKTDANGRFQWAVAESGTAGTWLEHLLCDRKGNIYVAGAIRCETSDRCTGRLGSLSLTMLYPNVNYNPDVFFARLFDADAVVPELNIASTSSTLTLLWPVEAANFVLETAASLPASSWNAVTNAPTVSTTECSVQLPIPGDAKFFRLRKP